MAKTNIRQPALKWFFEKNLSVSDPVIASKFYTPNESWSNSRVWFFQVPKNQIEPNKVKFIYLVCQNMLGEEPFFYSTYIVSTSE